MPLGANGEGRADGGEREMRPPGSHYQGWKEGGSARFTAPWVCEGRSSSPRSALCL